MVLTTLVAFATVLYASVNERLRGNSGPKLTAGFSTSSSSAKRKMPPTTLLDNEAIYDFDALILSIFLEAKSGIFFLDYDNSINFYVTNLIMDALATNREPFLTLLKCSSVRSIFLSMLGVTPVELWVDDDLEEQREQKEKNGEQYKPARRAPYYSRCQSKLRGLSMWVRPNPYGRP
nr:hypothetical protein [Tanacetum cinerariifolium]